LQFLLLLAGIPKKQSSFRVGLDLGYTVPSNGGGGILFSVEPKYNIKEDMNIGLRIGIGAAAMARDIQSNAGTATSAKISANESYVGTYDYYFDNSGKSFVPYIGGGVGYYSLENVEFDDISTSIYITLDATGKMGGLVRGGFE
jgi:outer membrane protein X